MKYLDFEKHIKKELENSTESVQMDSLLASLDLGEKKPTGKGFAFWMLIPLLLLVGSVITWQLMDTNGEGNNNSVWVDNSAPTDENTIAISSDEEMEIEYAKISNNKILGNDGEINTSGSNAGISANSLPSTNRVDQYSELKSENSIKPNLNLQTKSTENIEENFPIQTTNSTPLQNKVQNNVDLSNSYIAKKDFSSIEASNRSTSLTEDDEGSSNSYTKSKLSRDLMSIDMLGNSVGLLDEENVDGKLFSRMKINCPSFDNAGWHMALIPEIGVFKPFKTLESGSLDESTAFKKRTESEKTLEGIELGLYGMLVRDNVPLYLKAGVSYSRISERMDLSYEYIQLDTTVGVISTTVSGNGDTITHVYGDIVTETTFKGSNRQHHYIHLFDIPISMGYTTYIAGLDVGIEAGIKLNFMTRATGNLLVSEKDYTNLSLNRLFKNRLGVSYFGGLMIGRNFGKFGDIYIAPRFTYFPSEFNNQDNHITQRYFNIGLNAGVVYKIN